MDINDPRVQKSKQQRFKRNKYAYKTENKWNNIPIPDTLHLTHIESKNPYFARLNHGMKTKSYVETMTPISSKSILKYGLNDIHSKNITSNKGNFVRKRAPDMYKKNQGNPWGGERAQKRRMSLEDQEHFELRLKIPDSPKWTKPKNEISRFKKGKKTKSLKKQRW